MTGESLGETFMKEFSIYTTLKTLARQRVAAILQPGNVWVIEKSIPNNDETEENLRTCYLRGWVEPQIMQLNYLGFRIHQPK